ncbi:Pimeloyl-ACP methyl ester carboxylesterase [Anaerosphaera aminiphila DSM 21120]|uniref:prolyl aminopeptidase n=1 Tax=Anaerosphaera aminiphila DSM 21120 TaxID=1120995 RepID=A0A1M5TKP0_9FIRM|nr:alpha/beta hydrolase [Anaerosphaera aminiphila]SHH51375.1 Pimeloyl-ACP methyl ester carboxylesterase [Anaerosphaera aminiphila DSM 21120]
MILFTLIVLFFIVWGVGRFINSQKFKIRSENGIQKTHYITIGGIEQYVQIRGQDILNPIIIVIHGGPGNNMAYYSYYWQANLEEKYTLVHWDQRGCGNTYYRNPKAENPTLDLLLSDLDELVNYICSEYGKEKVVIMGHSWGTFLGGVYVGKHPEKVLAYVGVGQFNDIWTSEEFATEEAIRLANLGSKTSDAEKIKEQFQLVKSSQKIDMKEFMKLRQLTGKYLPNGENTGLVVRLFSPYMTFNDLRWFFSPLFNFNKFIETQRKLYDILYSESGLSMYNHTKYEVPVIIIAGDCDWITPYSMAQKLFDSISEPRKEFITIEKGGHIPFKPGVFTDKLSNALNTVL